MVQHFRHRKHPGDQKEYLDRAIDQVYVGNDVIERIIKIYTNERHRSEAPEYQRRRLVCPYEEVSIKGGGYRDEKRADCLHQPDICFVACNFHEALNINQWPHCGEKNIGCLYPEYRAKQFHGWIRNVYSVYK